MKHSTNPQRVAIAPSCHWLWIRKVATAIAMTLGAGAVCLWIHNDRSPKALAADALATNPSLTPVSVSWTGLPLRQVADRLSELARQPIIVDRRLDPDTRITLNVTQQPLADVLLSVAKLAHAERAMLGSWMRLCPTGQAAALEAARIVRSAEVASLPAAYRTLAAKRHKWSWPEGASPRDLLFAAATEGGIGLDGIPAIPHDHFPAASLPPLSLADRLDLLLAHFDRRVAWKKRPSPQASPTYLGLKSWHSPRLPPQRPRAQQVLLAEQTLAASHCVRHHQHSFRCEWRLLWRKCSPRWPSDSD